jgi:hypothetical protein
MYRYGVKIKKELTQSYTEVPQSYTEKKINELDLH